MSLINKIKNVFEKFEDLLFENHSCICCGREIPDETKYSLCRECFSNMEIIKGNVCAKCGMPIAENVSHCGECNKFHYAFDKNISYCFYDDISSSIVKQLKYSSKKYYAKYIAEMMSENLDNYRGIDFITFVPVNKTRLKFRGYNQAEEIAKEISKISKIPVVSALNKNDGGKNQAELSMKDRLENLKGSFTRGEDIDKIKDKTVLLIDDVFTTGTTLNECSKILKTAKLKLIYTMTFAKTKFEKDAENNK